MDSKRFFFYYFLYYFTVGAIDSLLFGLGWNAPYANYQQQISYLTNPYTFVAAAQGILSPSGFFFIFAVVFDYFIAAFLFLMSVLVLFGDLFGMIISVGVNAFFFLPFYISFFIGTVSGVAFALNLVFSIRIAASGAKSQ